MDRATLEEVTEKFEPGTKESWADRPRHRLAPIAFKDLPVITEGNYLVKGVIPADGLTVVWGPPKSGKSFWATDALLHVALGWPYRGRRVTQGPVVYVACEGGSGFGRRLEAFRLHYNLGDQAPPFFVIPARLGLVSEHNELVGAIQSVMGDIAPLAVVIDTLNRSFEGDENSAKDMGAYILAADAVRVALGCAVVLVHHCGVDGSRPRGSTALTGAVDAQIAIKRDAANLIRAEVEWMKDGPEDFASASRLESIEVGTDEDGESVTSCVLMPADDEAAQATETGPRLSKNQETMFSILYQAGADGLTTEDWNAQAREVGIGTKRKADLYDIRGALGNKGLIHSNMDRWYAKRQ